MKWPGSTAEWETFLKTSGLEPVVAETALRLAWRAQQQLGLRLTLSSGYRSPAHQKALQARWDRGDRQGLKVRPADNSEHTTGRAFDVDPDGPEPSKATWQQLGRLGESLGLRWGGRFNEADPVHFAG